MKDRNIILRILLLTIIGISFIYLIIGALSDPLTLGLMTGSNLGFGILLVYGIIIWLIIFFTKDKAKPKRKRYHK